MATKHANQQIAEALQAKIEAALTTAGNNVYLWRGSPIPDANLPAVVIGGAGTQDQVLDRMFKGREHRQLDIPVRCLVKSASATALSDVETLRLGVEKAIAADDTLGGLVKGGALYSGASHQVDEVGEKTVLEVEMIYQVSYDVDPAAPDTIL